MKRFLVFVVILCVAFLLYAGAQETVEPGEVKEEILAQPTEPPVTRLDVTIIDGVNDKLIKLNNCMVYVIGELHVVNDSFTYKKTFVEGDRYDITIHFRPKK